MALIDAGAPIGLSHMEIYDSFSTAVALDIIQVSMTHLYSHQERPYPETREAIHKSFRQAIAVTDPKQAERDRVKKSIASMAKYRKAR